MNRVNVLEQEFTNLILCSAQKKGEIMSKNKERLLINDYKGFTIDISRFYDIICFTVTRNVDELIIIDSSTNSPYTVQYVADIMKERIRRFIQTKGESELLGGKYEIASA